MSIEQESGSEETTLTKLTRAIERAPIAIQEEVGRTGQSWFSCFATQVWKNIPTLLDTAKIKGEITGDQFKNVSEKIENLLNELSQYEKEAGTPETYSEEIPPVEIREKLLSELANLFVSE